MEDKSKLSGVAAALTAAASLLDKVTGFTKEANIDWGLLVLSAAVLGYLYLRRLQNAALSHLAKPELLERVATKDADLFGREDDLEKLVEACRANPQIFLVGESGVGKSAILKIGLRNKLHDDPGLHPVFVDTLEGKANEESHAVTKAILDSGSPETPIAHPENTSFVDFVRQAKAELKKTILLIIDGFEVYVSSQRKSLIHEDTRTWISAEELIKDSPFWRDVHALLADGSLKLLIASRNDDTAGITTTFRLSNAKVFDLERLSVGAFYSKMGSLVQQEAVALPENGWKTLVSRLAEDLSPDGWVLPIQMTVALRGLVMVRPLTVRAYLAFGGLRGLEGAVVRSQVAAVARKVALNETEILEVLLVLFDRKNGQATPRTVSEICELLKSQTGQGRPRYTAEAVSAALVHLDSVHIVRRRVTPGDPEERWSLYHDYLHRGVLSAERRLNEWAARFHAQHEAHQGGQSSPLQFWNTLVPPWLLVVLLWKRIRGRFHFGSRSKYAALSVLRLVPYLTIFLTPLVLVDFGISLPGAVSLRHEFIRAGVALPRTLYRTPGANARIASALTAIRAELKKRIEGGWVKTAPDILPKDYWAQPQEIAAELRSRHIAPVDLMQLVGRARLMLDKDTQLIGQDGQSYGWSTDATLKFPRAEPLLWLGSALALSLQHATDASTKAQITEDLSYVLKLCDIYFDKAGGGWFRFAGHNAEPPESYVSAMALFMLLDLHSAHATGEISGVPLEQVSRLTLRWLQDNIEKEKGVVGWRDVPKQGIYQISPQLTVFIYSQLLRARQIFTDTPEDVILPAPILDHIRTYLTSFETAKDDPVERGVAAPLTIPEGNQQVYYWFLGYLWLPWEIELTRSALDLADGLKWSGDEKALRYHLNDILDNDLPTYVDKALKDYTFKLAEVLYALEPFEDARLDEAPTQATAAQEK